MDWRYYEMLRCSGSDEFDSAINDPEDELYGIVWGLFERLVIDPAEIIKAGFCGENRFRYSISSEPILEFIPEDAYFTKRLAPAPADEESGPAGIHLQFVMLPRFSCLFSVRLAIWGAEEHRALKYLWQRHRHPFTTLLRRIKPVICVDPGLSRIRNAESVDHLLDLYFSLKDGSHHIEFQYPFASTDDADDAQNFMIAAAVIYESVRGYVENRSDSFKRNLAVVRDFYSGHFPQIPPPLPCVDLAVATDAG